MLKLKDLSIDFLQSHENEMDKRFTDAISGNAYNNLCANLPARPKKVLDFLSDNRKQLFTGKPSQLRGLVKTINRQFPRFSAYARLRPKITSTAYNEPMAKIVKAVELMFDYDAFANKKRSWSAYNLVGEHMQRICPYCHLSHLGFYMESRVGGFMMRPPLDHFYPRSLYPYLAVSAFNLIPSCVQCNSSVKRDIDPLPLNMPHPYGPNVRLNKVEIEFEVLRELPIEELRSHAQIELRMKPTGKTSRSWMHFFKLAERYDWYTPEIFDLYKRAAKFSDLRSDWDGVPNLPLEYILGFDVSDAESRPIGICLQQVAGAIVSSLEKEHL